MLICPASYETLNHNFTLYTKVETIPSHVCDVGSEHGNDPRMDNDVEEKRKFNSGEDNSETYEINNAGERQQSENKNYENEGRIRYSFLELQRTDDSLKSVR